MAKLTPGEEREQATLLAHLSVGLTAEEKEQFEQEIRQRAAAIYSHERQLWESLAGDSAKITIMTKNGAVFSNKGINFKQN